MKFVVLGASGFSYEVTDLIHELGHEIVAFLGKSGETGVHDLTSCPITDSLDGLAFDAFVIAIGHTSVRKSEFERLRRIAPFATLIHPSACLSPHATIGEGCLLMQNVVVNAKAVVGANTVLNVGCCIAHDCVVGEHVHIAPGVQMGGGSSVGEGTFCGTSTVILPHVAVGAWAVCGAGAVVNKPVRDDAIVAGVPAVEIKVRQTRGVE